jgi:putative sigma-54 modulation protein
MQTSVTFKNLDPSETLKSYVKEKLDRLDKFLDNPAEANAVLSVEKFRHTAEINIKGDRLNIIGKEETNDMYSAVDMAFDKLEKQIKKNKQKNKEHRGGTKNKTKGGISQASPVPEEFTDRQIRIKNIEYKPMYLDEAVMQMDLVSDTFLVFTNARTDRINVLYRRNDGHYGLIQPSS